MVWFFYMSVKCFNGIPVVRKFAENNKSLVWGLKVS